MEMSIKDHQRSPSVLKISLHSHSPRSHLDNLNNNHSNNRHSLIQLVCNKIRILVEIGLGIRGEMFDNYCRVFIRRPTSINCNFRYYKLLFQINIYEGNRIPEMYCMARWN